MAIGFTQSRSATTGFATSIALAYTSNVTSGALLVAGEGSDNTTVPTCSDDKNGAWPANDLTRITSGVRASLFHFANAAAGATTVTVSWGVNNGAGTLAIAEYSGMATSSPTDKTQGGDGFGTAATTAATATTTQADELLAVMTCREFTAVDGHFTPGTNYNEREDPATDPRPGELEDRIVSATGAYSGAATLLGGSENWTEVIVTFKAAAGGGGAARPFVDGLSLMGCV